MILLGPIQHRIFCDSEQCEWRTWGEGWRVLHGHSGTIKPRPQAGHGSVCPVQVSVAKPKMGKFPLSYGSFEVRVLCLYQRCCRGADRPPLCGGAESSGGWRHGQATAAGASRRERMDVGVECQLERTSMTAREGPWGEKGRFVEVDLLVWWEPREAWGAVEGRCEVAKAQRAPAAHHYAGAAPSPSHPPWRSHSAQSGSELQVLWSLMKKIWLP